MVGSSCSGCDILCLLMWQAPFFIHSSMRSHRAVWDTPGIVVQSLSRVRLFEALWTAAHQASLSSIISRSWLRFMSVESVMPSNHLIVTRGNRGEVFGNVQCYLHVKFWLFFFSVKVGPWHSAVLLREEGQSPASPCCSFPISCLSLFFPTPFLPLFCHLPTSFFPLLSKALDLYWCLAIVPVRWNT